MVKVRDARGPRVSNERRTGRAQFAEERELTVMLVADVSGSGDFGTAGQLKRELITDIDAETARLYAVLDNLSVLRAEAVEFEAKNLAKADKIRALVRA